MENVSEQVEERVEEGVEQEQMVPGVEQEQMVPGVEQEQMVHPTEQPMEQEVSLEPPTPAPRPRVRKVGVKGDPPPVSQPPTQASRPTPDPNYWNSRLQEHRSSQRLAKDERYGNLRIM